MWSVEAWTNERGNLCNGYALIACCQSNGTSGHALDQGTGKHTNMQREMLKSRIQLSQDNEEFYPSLSWF